MHPEPTTPPPAPEADAPTVARARRPDPVDVELGRHLRQARQHAKLSCKAVALSLGISGEQLRKYEIGHDRVSVARLVRLAPLLGTTASHVVWQLQGCAE